MENSKTLTFNYYDVKGIKSYKELRDLSLDELDELMEEIDTLYLSLNNGINELINDGKTVSGKFHVLSHRRDKIRKYKEKVKKVINEIIG